MRASCVGRGAILIYTGKIRRARQRSTILNVRTRYGKSFEGCEEQSLECKTIALEKYYQGVWRPYLYPSNKQRVYSAGIISMKSHHLLNLGLPDYMALGG